MKGLVDGIGILFRFTRRTEFTVQRERDVYALSRVFYLVDKLSLEGGMVLLEVGGNTWMMYECL